MRKDIIERKEEILKWIVEKQSKAYIIKQLKCKQDTLNNYLKLMGIEYDGNMAGKGLRKPKVSLDDIINNKVKFNSSYLRIRLINDGVLKNECAECSNNGIWNGKPITLEIDHINGDNNDNRLENLRVLCPNCHSQTPTFRRKK